MKILGLVSLSDLAIRIAILIFLAICAVPFVQIWEIYWNNKKEKIKKQFHVEE